jgi:hypothetical protein
MPLYPAVISATVSATDRRGHYGRRAIHSPSVCGSTYVLQAATLSSRATRSGRYVLLLLAASLVIVSGAPPESPDEIAWSGLIPILILTVGVVV